MRKPDADDAANESTIPVKIQLVQMDEFEEKGHHLAATQP